LVLTGTTPLEMGSAAERPINIKPKKAEVTKLGIVIVIRAFIDLSLIQDRSLRI
jgi:uncharacterized membrane protein